MSPENPAGPSLLYLIPNVAIGVGKRRVERENKEGKKKDCFCRSCHHCQAGKKAHCQKGKIGGQTEVKMEPLFPSMHSYWTCQEKKANKQQWPSEAEGRGGGLAAFSFVSPALAPFQDLL